MQVYALLHNYFIGAFLVISFFSGSFFSAIAVVSLFFTINVFFGSATVFVAVCVSGMLVLLSLCLGSATPGDLVPELVLTGVSDFWAFSVIGSLFDSLPCRYIVLTTCNCAYCLFVVDLFLFREPEGFT